MKIQHSSLRGAVGAAFISLLAMMTGGCASILHSGHRTVTINTVPSGATATVSKAGTDIEVHKGTTPMTVTLDPKGGFFRGQNYVVKLEMPGYHWIEVPIRAELSGWYWGNIVFGGLIGMLIVDPATGSMWNLSPKDVQYSLNPTQVTMINGGKGFVVALVSDLTDEQRAKMVRIN